MWIFYVWPNDNWNQVFWGLNRTFDLNQTKWHMIQKTQLKLLSNYVKLLLKSISLGFGTIIKNGLPQIVPLSALVIRDYLHQTKSQ